MSLYNEDELVAPSWVNQQFLETVLINNEKSKNIEIKNFDISPASMKGDHYASIMFRCKVNYHIGKNDKLMKKSLIIKTLPMEDGLKREMLTETKLFETEIEMYTEALPKIEKILAECGEPTKLSAKIYYHSLEPHKVLVFEDLCEAGYDTVRNRYLTEEEIKKVYCKLAKLHAVSFMLGHSEEHELVTKYQEGIFNMSVPMMKDMLNNGIKNLSNLLESHEEFSIYAEKFNAMKDELEQASKKLYNAFTLHGGIGDIFVLNHGDFHMKNMMFKFNKNKMEDVIMVDYQISCYAPSTIDLSYSQFMLLSSDLRLRRHELTQYYFTEFSRILKKINCQGRLPMYSEFQIASLKYRHFTVILLAVFLPLVVGVLGKTLEELKDTDMTELMENPDKTAENYNLPEFIEEIRRFMPILLREGYLD